MKRYQVVMGVPGKPVPAPPRDMETLTLYGFKRRILKEGETIEVRNITDRYEPFEHLVEVTAQIKRGIERGNLKAVGDTIEAKTLAEARKAMTAKPDTKPVKATKPAEKAGEK